ncbi:regulator of microtubule dynamics protein 3 [Latimeria chalumnae]|uniref:Regulator of microtubule dynamics 2 n=1 Tax=Latimeria chalumnae TaxID=7897 RepID=H3B9M0_LATCH|nr:PREDICTED: regulator of microtubule dynamics protein 3-like [Latimeria chalumnae]|eukprot:XP_005991666.1 PREDICTED: regulator of microtubule dynamics protein 3-like [Latimeria chalumnae]
MFSGVHITPLTGVMTGVGILVGSGLIYYWRQQDKKREAFSSCLDLVALETAKSTECILTKQSEILQRLHSVLYAVEGLKVDLLELRQTFQTTVEKQRKALMKPQRKPSRVDTRKDALQLRGSMIIHSDSEDSYTTADSESSTNEEDRKHKGKKLGVGYGMWRKTAHMFLESTEPVEEHSLTELQLAKQSLLIDDTDKLHGGGKEEKEQGFRLLLRHRAKYGDRVEFCWRLVRAFSDMVQITEDEKTQKKFAITGKKEGAKAIQQFEDSPECHQWFAVMCGYLTDYETGEKSIEHEHLFTVHIYRAIELNPDNPVHYSLLGRWLYMRYFKSSNPRPPSMAEEPLKNFLKAEEIQPGHSKSTRFYIAQCYWILNRVYDASKWLEMALKMPSVTKEDYDIQEGLEALQESLERFQRTKTEVTTNYSEALRGKKF